MARTATLFVFLMLIVAISPSAYTAPIEFSRGGMDFVEVGDLGNVSSTSGYGAVAYSFGMGRHEVTINQYCEFLNAVAQSDPYGLYDTRMGTDLRFAGISRSGSSGSYAYSVMDNGGNSSNRPISNVRAYSAMRFANWMSNGKGSGSTETGAYQLDGRMYGPLPDRTPNAGFYIPTENEWYKAAFYDATLNGNSGGYYRYATSSDSSPGNLIGGAPNQANVLTLANGSWIASVTQTATYDPNQNYLTDVGAFAGSASFYGTFDQDGNVREWTFIEGLGTAAVRGLQWGTQTILSQTRKEVIFPTTLQPAGPGGGRPDDDDLPSYGYYDVIGLRLTHIQPVPEPSAVVLAGVGVSVGIVWHLRRRGVA